MSTATNEISFVDGDEDNEIQNSLGVISQLRKEDITKMMIDNPAKGTILNPKLEKDIVFHMSKLFGLYGMTLGENLRHYWVDLINLPGSLYTIEAGWEHKKKFVLIHGFGASSICFYRLIPF